MGDILGDLFGRSRGGARARRATKGQDIESPVTIDFASAVKGTALGAGFMPEPYCSA